jgi:hypothetical protein
MAEPRTRARFPEVAPEAPHYESFYLKACRPGGGLGVWVRYTVLKPPGAPAAGSLWCTLFDADAPGPVAAKATLPPDQLHRPAGGYVGIGAASFQPGRLAGEAPGGPAAAAWDLRFDPAAPAFDHYPWAWAYRARLPRTKLRSPYPAVRVHGDLTVGGRRLRLDGWPGMVGHNWGTEHAERWVWLHGAAFSGHGDGTFLDVAAGRVRLGGRTTPFVANGVLSLDGVRHRLGGPARARATRLAERPDGCSFRLAGRRVTVDGTVEAARKDLVGWVYADPGGGRHDAVNCSIATMRLAVRRAGQDTLVLESAGGAAYELGMRERDHGVALQPYPDGPQGPD